VRKTQLNVLANHSLGSENQPARLFTSVSFGSEGARVQTHRPIVKS
jgi:hypothetical protein